MSISQQAIEDDVLRARDADFIRGEISAGRRAVLPVPVEQESDPVIPVMISHGFHHQQMHITGYFAGHRSIVEHGDVGFFLLKRDVGRMVGGQVDATGGVRGVFQRAVQAVAVGLDLQLELRLHDAIIL